MALATNPLLAALTATNAHKVSANSSAKAPDPLKANASSFSDVYVKHTNTPPAVADKSPAKPDTAKTSSADNKPDAKDSSAATDKTVADSGNGLPAKPVTGKSENDKNGSDQAGSDKGNSDDSDKNAQAATDPTLSATPAVDPSQDPALLANQPVAPAVPAVDDKPAIDPAMLLSSIAAPSVPAPVVTPSAAVTTEATDGKFDPSADPLAGLTAVQVALDNKAQQAAQNSKAVGGTGKSTDDTGKTSGKQNPGLDPSQQLPGNLAALADQSIDKSTTEGGGDKAFSGLIADGLKDVKAATSDTRVDNFADRLAALSQAAAPVKSAAAPATPLLNQPLAMNQSGWSEGVVNRVMYLSSQNLKQADIQLEPAELGRLNIRVNMAADQQTQVTFMSAHVGVRDALESQMSRLRDSFNQQGMGQVDVNVSDQSQGWQQQAQQQQSGNGSQRSSASNGSGNGVSGVDGIADGSPLDPATAAASAPLTVVGSSAVDYYA